MTAEGESAGSTGDRGLRSVIQEHALVFALVGIAVVLAISLSWRLATGAVEFNTIVGFTWQGIVLGMAIGLAGIGLAMTYSILKFANFAHGDYVTVGAFAGWMVTFLIAGLGTVSTDLLVLISSDIDVRDLGIHVFGTPLAITVGLVVAAVATAGISVLIDRVVFKPMRDASGVALLIASVGVALILRHVLLIFFGGRNRGVTEGVRTADVPAIDGTFSVGAHEVTLVVLAALLMALTHVLLQYTKLGTAMRAMADNEDLALVTGIPTERVVLTTWLLGGALTGAAGFLLALESGTLDTTFGWELLLLIFSAVILGGIGSVYGAIVGGLIIGIASRLTLVYLPSDLVVASAFAVMVVVLLVRPQGLLGGVETV